MIRLRVKVRNLYQKAQRRASLSFIYEYDQEMPQSKITDHFIANAWHSGHERPSLVINITRCAVSINDTDKKTCQFLDCIEQFMLLDSECKLKDI